METALAVNMNESTTIKNTDNTKPFGEADKFKDKNDAKSTMAEIKEKMIEVKDQAIVVKDNVIDRGGKMATQVRTFVTAHPLKAIAIAFAVGYVGMRVTRPLRWL